MQTDNYPLRNSLIFDPGATISLTNNADRLINPRQARPGDFVWTGEGQLPILAYGTMDVKAGNSAIRLEDVAFCPRLITSLISFRQLRRKGYHWDTRSEPTKLRRRDNSVVCQIMEKFGQYVLEYVPENTSITAFIAYRKKFHSATRRPPRLGDGLRWHQRLGHPGPEAIRHLVNASQGVRLQIQGPPTIDCEACALAKIPRQVSRTPRTILEGVGERLAVDFHDYEEGAGGYTSQLLFTCRVSGYIWDYYLTDRKRPTLITAFQRHINLLKNQFDIRVKVIECDNEITEANEGVGKWLTKQSIQLEPSSPYTQAQNGGAERSGGVVKEKARAMRIGAKLPHNLWPEINKTAVYLYNRTPNYGKDLPSTWSTPYERFHTANSFAKGIVIHDRRPDQSFLRVFGCKAYAMTATAQKKEERLQRLNPKAWVGFLIGYRSSNIYRIWIPSLNRIINTRDVLFKENEVFDGDKNAFKDDLRATNLDEISRFVQDSALPEADETFEPEAEDVIETTTTTELEVTTTDETEEADESPLEIQDALGQTKFEFMPTPPQTPPAALLGHSIQAIKEVDQLDPRREATQTVPWIAAFLAGTKAAPIGKMENQIYDKAKLERLLRQGVKVHRSQLPPPPKDHRMIRDHPMEKLFHQAEKDHLKSHKEMNSWSEILKNDPRAANNQILDCMWVYVYKFDKHGRFSKCKARLVVRGDQQAKGDSQETYAATLAGRSFRTLVAIAARFDLELIQYDVVNAFVHAKLDQDIFMRMPHGYRKRGTILLLNKALYGLRISPLLWQKELTETLKSLKFTQVPHEPCCLLNDGVLLFFYVDDVIVAYRKGDQDRVNQLIKKLQEKYKMSGGDPVQWFLGTEVLRDRARRRIWLAQTAYIEKIVKLAEKKTLSHKVPMTNVELMPRQDAATPKEINKYQKKIGSLLFAAVSTRPDVAFATSRLARFLTNPSQEHQDAADRVLLYLHRTKHLALQFGGADDLKVASDASFADNTLDRKSSQAFAMRLFGGLIGWRANKQDTVTTSTTEAELLALAQAAKETLFVSRLLKELSIVLDDKTIHIECDNQQTIKLVTAEIALLKTKLRHVDIHNHWLRQEISAERITVDYTPSAKMVADGLTKALPTGSWSKFLTLLGMVDVQAQQEQRELGDKVVKGRIDQVEDQLIDPAQTRDSQR